MAILKIFLVCLSDIPACGQLEDKKHAAKNKQSMNEAAANMAQQAN